MRQILVDSNNLWCRAYYATPPEAESPATPCSIMTYMIRGLLAYFGSEAIDEIVLCWDKGRSGRDVIDPNYKAHRTLQPGKEKVWEDIRYIKKLLSSLGIRSGFLEGYEADDIISSLSYDNYDETFIVSNDKDFYQVVDDKRNIKVFRPEQKVRGKQRGVQIIKEKEVLEEFGCKPHQVILFKSLKGDDSDNIPKLVDSSGKTVRWTKKFKEPFYTILSTLNVHTIDEFYEHVSLFDPKHQQALNHFYKIAKTNFKLVKMKKRLRVKTWKQRASRREFDYLCEDLNIKNLRFSDFRKDYR